MPITFPSTPNLNDTYTFNNKTWSWNGTRWVPVGNRDFSIEVQDDSITASKLTTGSVTADKLNLGNSHLPLPVGTTAQRPLSPSNGDFRVNSTNDNLELYYAGDWFPIGYFSAITATGGDNVYDIFTQGFNYRVHAFTQTGNFEMINVPTGSSVDVLIVAGGGGGGAHVPGAGGAGGLIYRPGLSLSSGIFLVEVGSGGTGSYNNGAYAGMPNSTRGGNSTFAGLTALGGGFGMSWTQDARSCEGGSGGSRNTGGGSPSIAGIQTTDNSISADSRTYGFGNAGSTTGNGDPYANGGGGGAGGPGSPPPATNICGNGGDGKYYGNEFGSFYGEFGWFAGGGGGGSWGLTKPGSGGLGGGGDGDCPNSGSTGASLRLGGSSEPTGENGKIYSGGGGGGGGRNGTSSSRGGNGGSGVVLIRYRI